MALSLDGTGGAAAIGDLLCDFAKVAGVPANSSGIETTVQRIAALSF
ncbi:MAG: hypothetical protein ACM3IH_04675 [Sphingobacteriales bacterium]